MPSRTSSSTSIRMEETTTGGEEEEEEETNAMACEMPSPASSIGGEETNVVPACASSSTSTTVVSEEASLAAAAAAPAFSESGGRGTGGRRTPEGGDRGGGEKGGGERDRQNKKSQQKCSSSHRQKNYNTTNNKCFSSSSKNTTSSRKNTTTTTTNLLRVPKDPLRPLFQHQRNATTTSRGQNGEKDDEKEEFIDFLFASSKDDDDDDDDDDDGEDDGITLKAPMEFVREAAREYPGVKLNRELLEDIEAALAGFGSRGVEEKEQQQLQQHDKEEQGSPPPRRRNFLRLEDFKENIDERTGTRMVFLTLPSSKEDAAMKENVLLNTLKISEQNREVGEREEKARREDLLEAKKKLVCQANTSAAAKKTSGVGKKKTSASQSAKSAAATKKKKEDTTAVVEGNGGGDDDEGESTVGREDIEEDEDNGFDLEDDGAFSGSCVATRRFNNGKFQLEQSKKIHGAVADEKVFKILREFKKEIYETYRLRSLVETMDFSNDNDGDQKSNDRENVLECIQIWINMRGMVVSARLALIERERFLKDCEATSKFASEYRKDTKTVAAAVTVPTDTTTTTTTTSSSSLSSSSTTTSVIAPSKTATTKAADTTTKILKQIPTYNIANRSLSSFSILFNDDEDGLLDDECIEGDDDVGKDNDQHVLTIEDQLERAIETYEQDRKFHQIVVERCLGDVTPAGKEFRDATAKLEKALGKILHSPTLKIKSSHDRDRLFASTKWSTDQTMVFDDLVLRCDNAHFPSNDKACKAADDINRHVLYRAGSVLKKAFEIISGFIEKDLVVGFFKKSAAQLFSSTLEREHRSQFANTLNNILDPYDTSYYGSEAKLLLYTRIRVTRAMEIDSALRERAEQTVISACVEQMLSEKYDLFSRQKTDKFIEQLLFEEEMEKEEEKMKAVKASSSSSKKKKKKKKKNNRAAKATPARISEKEELLDDEDKEEEEEEEEEDDDDEEEKEEVTATIHTVPPAAFGVTREDEEHIDEGNLEAWQEVKKVRATKSSPSSVIVAPKDLVLSKVKISPVKRIPTAKHQHHRQQKELSSSPPLPKTPPPKEVVNAAVEKKREGTRRVLFVDTLKKKEETPAVVVEKETKEEGEVEERDEDGELQEVEEEEKTEDDREERNGYVVRNVSDIEHSFCTTSNPPSVQQQHYHHHQHYQPPLPQMPPPQMIDGQRVVYVPMIIPDNGSMTHPMSFGMHHLSMAPPLPPQMPQLPDTSEAVASMYNQFYQDPMMQQQRAPPPPPSQSPSSNVVLATNEAASDTASTASDDHLTTTAMKSSSSSSPPLPKTPPPKGQQQTIQQHHHKSSSSSPSMSPSASSSSIRIPSPRPIDTGRISSSAFPKPRPSSKEHKRDNHHHHYHHRGSNNNIDNNNSKREDEFPEVSLSVSKDMTTKASNTTSLAKSNKSWAEAQMELKGTNLPSLMSSPVKPPSPPRQHQMQRQVA